VPGGDLASWTNLPGIVISVVALVLRFRRARAVQRQQIKWFAYGAALSIPLGLFPEAEPWGPYLELLGFSARLRDQVDLDTLSAADRAPFARAPVGLRGGHG